MKITKITSSLEDRIKELMQHLVPQTDDKELLNEISTKQISNVTYRNNELLRYSSDSNILVPRDLNIFKKNQAWRYPPNVMCNFHIEKNQDVILKIKGGFGIVKYLRYGEYRKTKTSTQKRYLSNPQIDLPDEFSNLEINGENYQLLDNGKFMIKSVSPDNYEFDYEIKIDELAKEEEGEIVETISIEKTVETIKSLDDLAFVDLISGQANVKLVLRIIKKKNVDNSIRIEISLVNETDIDVKPHRFPDELKWRTSILILPFLDISVVNSNFIIPPQQHAEVLKSQLRASSRDNNLGTDDAQLYYEQYNCVLTKSTIDLRKILILPFGVFDMIREEPSIGPNLGLLISSKENLLKNMNLLTKEHLEKIKIDYTFEIIKNILKSAKDGFQIENLYTFQWEAIQNRIIKLLNDEKSSVTIIKAPTGTGKTIVFMVNAALHSLLKEQRSVLAFPTRILNEDMFKRLTAFIYHLRKNLQNNEITGGLHIGQYDPLFRAMSDITEGQLMIQYDLCPKCKSRNQVHAKLVNSRMIGVCDNCDHHIDYMFRPTALTGEAEEYIPLMTIATPDKLFYEATVAGYELGHLRFFGGSYQRCSCGFCIPLMNPNKESIVCNKCNKNVHLDKIENSPIGYFVFDEIHSLYGLTGILLSVFLKTLKIMSDKIIGNKYYKDGFISDLTFETGTATIANDVELLSKITRSSNISVFPKDSNRSKYFKINDSKVRYRTVLILPVSRSSRTTVSNALMHTFIDLHETKELKQKINNVNKNDILAYDFILGYLYRKRDGYSLRKALIDMSRKNLGYEILIDFLSGDSKTVQISEILTKAINGDIKLLLANLVISLGVDIENLNNMIMLGVPRTMTEFVQTAGRTGRGVFPGHVVIHLLPSIPRDLFWYENFHSVMSDVKGYFDVKPTEQSNAFATRLLLPNIMKAIIAAQSYRGFNQYSLTAPSFTKNIGANSNRQKALEYDILNAMVESSSNKDLIREIALIIRKGIIKYIQLFRVRKGPNQYIANILKEEDEFLFSLRAKTERDVILCISDVKLYEVLEKQRNYMFSFYEEDDLLTANEVDEDN